MTNDIGNLGMGVLINMLSGSDQRSQEAAKQALGKKIASAKVEDDVVTLVFEGGAVLRLKDDGQSCCGERYLMTDDDPAELAGTTLVDIEVRDAPSEEDEYGECHEVQFLAIKTSLGTLTSRVLGMLRDTATAALLGMSGGGVMDAFVVAFRLPNLFRT